MPRRVFLALPVLAMLMVSACEDQFDTDLPTSTATETADEPATEQADPIFRAVGQEPGWFLQIYPDIMVYEADYGERRLTARTPEMTLTDGVRRYENDAFTVEIVDRVCNDVMSGAEYPSIVRITEDGRPTLSGCGSDL